MNHATNSAQGHPRTQALRWLLAFYFVSTALGIIDHAGIAMVLGQYLPKTEAAALTAIFLASCARQLVTGRNLRPVTLALMAFLVAARLSGPEVAMREIILHDGLLLLALTVAGGMFAPLVRLSEEALRVRLVRCPEAARPGSRRFGQSRGFTRSADDLEALFDQLREVPRV